MQLREQRFYGSAVASWKEQSEDRFFVNGVSLFDREALRCQKRKNKEEELGARMGVQRAQVSKIENGRNLTFGTIAQAFKALGIPAELSAGGMKVALW